MTGDTCGGMMIRVSKEVAACNHCAYSQPLSETADFRGNPVDDWQRVGWPSERAHCPVVEVWEERYPRPDQFAGVLTAYQRRVLNSGRRFMLQIAGHYLAYIAHPA